MKCVVFMILAWCQGSASSDPSETYLKRSAASWVQDLNHAQPKTRRAAAFALGKLGKHSLPHLAKMKSMVQSDTDAGVREALASTLGELAALAPTEIAATMIPAFTKETDVNVRRSMAIALGKAGEASAGAVPLLRKALEDADAGLRRNAAWALGHLGKASEPAIPQLIKTLTDTDAGVRAESAQALGNLGPVAEEAIPGLVKALNDGESQVQEQAILAVRKMGPLASSAIGSLLTIAESTKVETGQRQAAIISIEAVWPTGLKEPASWRRLQELAKGANEELVKATAQQAEKKVGILRQ